MKTWLVTGGTGFVGANLVRVLLARGDRVRCVVRKANLCLEGLDVEVHGVSLTDGEGLARVAAGCDGIFHLAGTFDPGPGGAAIMEELHVGATRALIHARRITGVPGFVLCSSSVTVGYGPLEAPGDEDTPLDVARSYGEHGPLRVYHDTKLTSERLTMEAGGVVVNPDYVLGPWDVKPTSGQLLLTVARRHMPMYPRGGKCFIDAGDCAVAHVRAMEVGIPGRRYLLGNHNLSYRRFMGLVAREVGGVGPWLPVPSLALRAAGRLGAALQARDPHRFAGLDRRVLLAMQQDRYRSGRRARGELGMPFTPMDQTVRATLAWFRAHGYLPD